MESNNSHGKDFPFLSTTGNASQLVKTADWASTALGPAPAWPLALKQATATALASPLPTLLCLGADFTVIFNDALERLLPAYTRNATGKKAADVYRDKWPVMQPVFRRALSGNAAVLPGLRLSAASEEKYLELACSPILNHLGEVLGISAVFIELNETGHPTNVISETSTLMSGSLGTAPIGICVLEGMPLRIREANGLFLAMFGIATQAKGQPAEFSKSMSSATLNYEEKALQVIETGKPFHVTEQRISISKNGIACDIYADLYFEPLASQSGQPLAVALFAIDATDRALAKSSLQNLNDDMVAVNEELVASNEELQAINEEFMASQAQLEESLELISEREQQMLALVESAPFPIAVYVGKEMRITHANRSIIEVWGKGTGVIGKTYREVLPELESQDIYAQLDRVYETGRAFHARNQLVSLKMHGEFKDFYFNYSFTPLFDKSGKVYGVMNTAADVSDLYQAKQQAEYSGQNFRNMILQAPVAMCLLQGPTFVVEMVNGSMLEIWGKPLENVKGKPVFEALPDARDQGLEQVMAEVYRTGIPFFAHEQPVSLIRHGKPDVVFQNFVYQPYRDALGNIQGVLAISLDVTEQVRARREVEKAYDQVRLSKKAAQLGTFDMDLSTGTLEWDDRCRELFGVNHSNEVTYQDDFVKGLHPEDRERVVRTIEKLFDSTAKGQDYDIEYRTVSNQDGRVRWIRAKGKVYFEDEKPVRFIGSVLDITQQKEDEIRLAAYAEKQARLAAIISSSEDIIISKTLEGVITSWNGTAERIFGYTQEEAIGNHISLIIPPERMDEEQFIISNIRKGLKVDHFETIRMAKDGRKVHLSITVSPIVDEQGQIIGASKIARDIGTRIASDELSRKYTERLEIMNMVIGAVSEELDLHKILQKVTDATTGLTGAKFGAFFYNSTDQNGESYTLYTLSGAPREAFEKFAMPRNTAVFHPTFSGEGVVRSDDITKDPRYGHNDPHFGMPKGHLPVTSYLAVPVVSRSGVVIGGLFFGHPEPGRFTGEHEALVASIAAQAAIGLDNAKLFEEVKALNEKKDEFIGLASHELKTPLASISGYLQIVNRLSPDQQLKKYLDKASLQVSRLTGLVNDLLDVSKIEAGKLMLSTSPFDLKLAIEESIELIRHSAPKYQIDFVSDSEQCLIVGDAQRIEQVVLNLLSNAIKYSPGTDRVEVSLACLPGKVLVGVRDFGLGIPKDKIANIFTRFYRVDDGAPNISGLGIGLYLAHEIIVRHAGEIWVESEPGQGSTFFFTLPGNPKA